MLDEVDRAIIANLVNDARLSNTELARRVHLTPAPCLRRVQRLEAAGVLRGYRAVVDPAASGRGFEVIVAVEIRLNDAGTVEAFEEAVAALDEVTEVHRMLGKPDYFVRVNVADGSAYERFVMERLTRLPAISTLVSHQTMKTLKTL